MAGSVAVQGAAKPWGIDRGRAALSLRPVSGGVVVPIDADVMEVVPIMLRPKEKLDD